MKLRTEVLESLVVELAPIIGDDGPGNSKLANDQFSNKVLNLDLSYLSEGFDFDPFGEVVNCYD